MAVLEIHGDKLSDIRASNCKKLLALRERYLPRQNYAIRIRGYLRKNIEMAILFGAICDILV